MVSDDFKEAVNNVEKQNLITGNVENGLDNIKQQLMGMSVQDRLDAMNYMMQENAKNANHDSIPQLSIEGDLKGSNFKVDAEWHKRVMGVDLGDTQAKSQ